MAVAPLAFPQNRQIQGGLQVGPPSFFPQLFTESPAAFAQTVTTNLLRRFCGEEVGGQAMLVG